VESHSAQDKAGARHQFIYHALPPKTLEKVWDIIVHITEKPGLEDFRDVRLFMYGKNLKVLIKNRNWQGI
jgi:hypothetical protein